MKKHDIILYSAIAICILAIIIIWLSTNMTCIVITTVICVCYGLYAIYDQIKLQKEVKGKNKIEKK